MESVEEEWSIFSNAVESFSETPYKVRKPTEDKRRNFNPFIPLCQYAGKPKKMTFRNCNLFRRSFTNVGLGYSFNNGRFQEMFKDNKMNNLMLKSLFFNNEVNIRYPESSGPDYALELVLDANIEEVQRYEKSAEDTTKKIKPFQPKKHCKHQLKSRDAKQRVRTKTLKYLNHILRKHALLKTNYVL